ncbi:MAG TPA: hypothetical protein VM733_03805 [Thermoanaerobaculia bacterium]|nr:hypothetical protein [Thermoanaerobaculia bacterium]
MSERKKTPPEPPASIDLSAIRYLLTLTPEERIRLAAEEARNLRRFDIEVEKSRER